LKKLTVLSLDGIVFCSEITTAIGDRLANEILPLRPPFWFFLGVNLYKKPTFTEFYAMRLYCRANVLMLHQNFEVKHRFFMDFREKNN